jgi:hypothetical protein
MNATRRISALPSDRRLRSWPLVAILVGCVFGFGLTTTAADPNDAKPATPKSTSTSSLDDELFKDLSDDVPVGKKPEPPTTGSSPDQPRSVEAKGSEPKPSMAEPSETKPAERKTSPKKPLDPLDEELLKDLGGDADPKPTTKPNDAAHGGSGGNKPAGGEPAKGDVDDPSSNESQSDDPLVRLSRRVRDAEERLRRTDSGDRTQELQRGIVEDLEKLIAQIEKQQAQQSSSKSKSPPGGAKPGPKKPGPPKPGSQPGDKPSSNPTDSSDQLTAKKTEKAEAGKLKEMLEKVWGRLPERERQDVMQSSFEDFPAKYQYSIEQYFRTLLERKD